MNTLFSIRRLRIMALVAASVTAGAFAGFGATNSADAASPTGRTFTLTFNGQTTGANKPIEGLKMEQEVTDAGKKSGNVDFTWTVEKAEQGPLPVLMTIKDGQ